MKKQSHFEIAFFLLHLFVTYCYLKFHRIIFMATKASKELTLKKAQQKVDDWIKTHGVRYFNELTNMAILTEEVGEVARIISRKYGEQSFKNEEDEKLLEDELADVLFVLMCIANQTGVDLNIAFEKNMEKKTKRDKDRHKKNKKLQ